MNWFEGKTALITGGASGIGSKVCEALIDSGRRVVLHDLRASDGEAKARSLSQRFGDGRAIFAPGDLSDLKRLRRDSEALAAEIDCFDFLANNAAIDPVGSNRGLFDRGVSGGSDHQRPRRLRPLPDACAAHEAQGRRRNRQHHERHSLWRLGRQGPYAMSKGALLGLTRSLARELGSGTSRKRRDVHG